MWAAPPSPIEAPAAGAGLCRAVQAAGGAALPPRAVACTVLGLLLVRSLPGTKHQLSFKTFYRGSGWAQRLCARGCVCVGRS